VRRAFNKRVFDKRGGHSSLRCVAGRARTSSLGGTRRGAAAQAAGAAAGAPAGAAPAAALAGAALAAGYGGAFLPAAARRARGRRRWAAALARALPWADAPAWAATALLMAQPLLQLARRPVHHPRMLALSPLVHKGLFTCSEAGVRDASAPRAGSDPDPAPSALQPGACGAGGRQPGAAERGGAVRGCQRGAGAARAGHARPHLPDRRRLVRRAVLGAARRAGPVGVRASCAGGQRSYSLPAQRLPCPKRKRPCILSCAQRPSAGQRRLPRGAACRSRACRAGTPGTRPAKPASIPPAPGSAAAPPSTAALGRRARSAHGGQLPALCVVAALALGAWAAAAASVDARSRGLPRALDSVLHTLHVAR